MTKLYDDAFERSQDTGWSTFSDGNTWSSGSGAIWTIASSEQESIPDEMCPICALLLETDEGIALFAKYMMVEISITTDGKGGGTSSSGWQCSMCGASGEGRIPEFHAKPI